MVMDEALNSSQAWGYTELGAKPGSSSDGSEPCSEFLELPVGLVPLFSADDNTCLAGLLHVLDEIA